MKSKATNIVLIFKSGGDFRFSDVYLLVSHINRYWSTALPRPNVYCYTDAVTEEKKVVGLTIRPIPNREWSGWWSKINMFAPSIANLRPFLYLDLDTIILNSLSNIIPPEKEQNNFITLRDFYRQSHLASGIMWIPKTAYMDKIYSEFISKPAVCMSKFRGDQNFIEATTTANLYWQDILAEEVVTTFKPNQKWRVERPTKSTVVCFHGHPRIPEAALTVDWVKQYTSYEI